MKRVIDYCSPHVRFIWGPAGFNLNRYTVDMLMEPMFFEKAPYSPSMDAHPLRNLRPTQPSLRQLENATQYRLWDLARHCSTSAGVNG